MKKILVIGLSDNIGGMETFFHTYYQHFKKSDYSFDFATVTDTIAFSEEYAKNGSSIFNLPGFLSHPIKYQKTLRQIIRKCNYDIVHINMLSAANILPIVAAKKEKVSKIIIHSHNYGTPSGLLRKTLNAINRLYLKNDSFIKVACSKKAGDWMFGENAKYKVVPNAIDLARFKFNNSNRRKIRNELKIGDSSFLLGNVGRLCEQKNQLFLIKLMGLLDDPFRLVIIGDGEKREQLEKEAKRLGVNKRVSIISNKRDVEKYYSAMDTFVFPSLFEGLGIVLIEAQANGLECICSEAIPEEANVGGIKMLPLDAEKWANYITDLAKHCQRHKYKMKQYDVLMQAERWSLYD